MGQRCLCFSALITSALALGDRMSERVINENEGTLALGFNVSEAKVLFVLELDLSGAHLEGNREHLWLRPAHNRVVRHSSFPNAIHELVCRAKRWSNHINATPEPWPPAKHWWKSRSSAEVQGFLEFLFHASPPETDFHPEIPDEDPFRQVLVEDGDVLFMPERCCVSRAHLYAALPEALFGRGTFLGRDLVEFEDHLMSMQQGWIEVAPVRRLAFSPSDFDVLFDPQHEASRLRAPLQAVPFKLCTWMDT